MTNFNGLSGYCEHLTPGCASGLFTEGTMLFPRLCAEKVALAG